MNAFILSYDPFSLAPSPGQILNFVRFNRLVTQYYQPFTGTYLLKSGSSAYDLNESFKGFFENSAYTVMQIWPAAAGGQLPPEIWNWLNDTPPSALGIGSGVAAASALRALNDAANGKP